MEKRVKEVIENALFTEDAANKPEPEFKEGRTYVIRRKQGGHVGSEHYKINAELKVTFVKATPTKDKVIHYVFKSVNGGYNISYTNIEIKTGFVKIA